MTGYTHSLYDPPRPWIIELEGHCDEVDEACDAIKQNQPARYQSHQIESLDDDYVTATIFLDVTDPTMITLVQSILDLDFPNVYVKRNAEVKEDERP